VWGSRKLYSVVAIVVGVTNLDRAVAWYCDKLGLSSQTKEPNKVYIGYPSADSDMLPMIILVPIPRDHTNVYATQHQILFTRNLDVVHAEFASKGIQTWPIQTDSGGNRFFNWQDLEGNTIEVCQEPEAPPNPHRGLDSGLR
jgi:catechol 2,3-dioxygenase-like lactoylglutathione lyase family enzyme